MAREYLYRHDVGTSPRQDLEVGQQAGRDRVTDQIRQPFFHRERIVHAPHVPTAVLDTDENRAAGSVGKGHDGAE